MTVIRNEVTFEGEPVSAEVIDLAAGTFTLEERGKAVSARPLTPDELVRYAPPAGDPAPAEPPPVEEKLAGAVAALGDVSKLTTVSAIRNALAAFAAALV